MKALFDIKVLSRLWIVGLLVLANCIQYEFSLPSEFILLPFVIIWSFHWFLSSVITRFSNTRMPDDLLLDEMPAKKPKAIESLRVFLAQHILNEYFFLLFTIFLYVISNN